MFLGCAPNIALDPKQGVHCIQIHVPLLIAPEFFADTQAYAPLSPGCKQALEYADWTYAELEKYAVHNAKLSFKYAYIGPKDASN